jgi:probable HAF family extracellular repeat protein
MSFSAATAISAGGAIIGGACVPACSGYEAFVLDNAGMRSLGALGGFASVAMRSRMGATRGPLRFSQEDAAQRARDDDTVTWLSPF